MTELCRAWLMYCWSEQDPCWLAHMGHMSFDEYLLYTVLPSWDAYPPF